MFGWVKQKERNDPRRREKAKSLEVELDLGGGFSRKSMFRSSLGNEKEAHLAVSGKFNQKEDVKMYIRLPDYDDFQRYDLGRGGGGRFKSGCS